VALDVNQDFRCKSKQRMNSLYNELRIYSFDIQRKIKLISVKLRLKNMSDKQIQFKNADKQIINNLEIPVMGARTVYTFGF
jgi:hypothetical protein